MSRVLMAMTLILTATLGLPGSAARAAEEPLWQLVEVIDYPNDDRWAKASEHPEYDYAASYAPHSFSITQTYVGKGDPDKRPPMVHGESLTVQAQTSAPRRSSRGSR